MRSMRYWRRRYHGHESCFGFLDGERAAESADESRIWLLLSTLTSARLAAGLPAVSLCAAVREITGFPKPGRARMLVARLTDGTGSIELVWFKGIRWLQGSLKPGQEYIAFGKVNDFRGKLSLPHPEMELAATYQGSMARSSAFLVCDGAGNDDYYDLHGRPLRKSFLKSPLNYRRISSGWSHARRSPITRQVQPHLGVDFAAAPGTPVEPIVYYVDRGAPEPVRQALIEEAKTLIKKYSEQQKNVRNSREFNSLAKEVEYQDLEIQLAEKNIKEFKAQIEQKKEVISETKERLSEREGHLKHKKGELDAILAGADLQGGQIWDGGFEINEILYRDAAAPPGGRRPVGPGWAGGR